MGSFQSRGSHQATIFDHAVRNGHDYDDAIRQKVKANQVGAVPRVGTAIEDVGRPPTSSCMVIFGRVVVDGWVSLEISSTAEFGRALAAARYCTRVGRPNLFIKIPGTSASLK